MMSTAGFETAKGNASGTIGKSQKRNVEVSSALVLNLIRLMPGVVPEWEDGL